MRITIVVARPPGSSLPRSALFLLNLIAGIAREQPGDFFVVFTDHRQPAAGLPANISNRLMPGGPFKWLALKWWYHFGLPRLLSRQKADLLVTIDNVHVRRYATPCCHFCVNLSAADPSSASGFFRQGSSFQPGYKRVKSVLQSAASVISLTEYDRQTIEQRYSLPPGKCKSLPLYRHNTPLKWTEKESIKTRYSGGLDYFIFAGDIHERHQLIELLKAFAAFKKWQRSSMQLIVTGAVTRWMPQFLEKLSSFRYRREVHVIRDPPEDAFKSLIGGAYALVYPAADDHFPDSILMAMGAGVPVIASPLPVIRELAGNAIIYPEPDDASGYAKCMQEIYKDEQLRSNTIRQAQNQLQQRNDHMAEDCRNLFLQILHANS